MLLGVNGVSKSYGTDIVLEDVSFRIERKQKVALVGRNGTGKTTLLRILIGETEADKGSVRLAKGVKIGYLRQEHGRESERTVREEAQAGQADQLALKERLKELEARLENGPTEEELEEYALVHEHFLEAEGYSLDHDATTVLKRMGFPEEDFDKPVSVLSGGERTRLALARLLLEEPDLLILDEPTNHLDLEATEWLEKWIVAYHGAVLLVSHDKVFLQNTAEGVLDLRERTVKSYEGGFDKYLKLKAEDDARRADLVEKQQAEIEKLDEFVRRFMNSQRTAQARGRQKLMNRLIEGRAEGPEREKGMAAGFGKAARSGDLVVSCEALSVGFDRPLFPPLDWSVRWGERWGVIGENGAGKSTLLRTILGEYAALSGRSRLGANVRCGYFRQDVTDLDPEMTPLGYMVYEANMDTGPARDLLGRFLFSGDDVVRQVKTLSGGEKNKLELARLTQMNPNLLVLDEPTNHLDMDSREALAEVLKEYGGTLILISHDRWLLSQVTDRLLDVRHSGAVVYSGGYADYRAGRQPVSTVVQKKATAPKAEELRAGLSPREVSKEIDRLEKLVADLEDEVSAAERELKSIEKELANLPPTADVFDLTRRYQSKTEHVASSLAAWEEQVKALEAMKELQGPTGVTFRDAN